MKRRDFLIAGPAALAALALPGSLAGPFQANAQQKFTIPLGNHSYDLDRRFDGLLTHDGREFKHEDMRGKPAAIFFGFLGCSQICGIAARNMAESAALIARRCGPDAVPNYIVVTIMPEYDTRESVAEWLKPHNDVIREAAGGRHPGMIGLVAITDEERDRIHGGDNRKGVLGFLRGATPGEQRIARIESLYKEGFGVLFPGSTDPNDHTSRLFLVGPDGKFIAPTLSTQDGPDKLARDIVSNMRKTPQSGPWQTCSL